MPAPRAYVLLLNQDDPRRCTGRRLVARGLALALRSRREVRRIRNALVLNPFGAPLLPFEVPRCEGLIAVDGSWQRIGELFEGLNRASFRRLPLLLAGNPTNYARPAKLSTLEALAASYYIGGFVEEARRLCALTKWGPTFLSLNEALLEEYRRARTEQELRELERAYFGLSP
jgi:pre-rRNA-processing protein TSR3